METKPVRSACHGAEPDLGGWGAHITCPDCYDGAPDAGPQNEASGSSIAEAIEAWNEEQFDRLEARAERLARQLWGTGAWLFTCSSGESSEYPLVDGRCSTSAHRSRRRGDLVSISVDYLPTQDVALRVLIASLEKALELRGEDHG